MSVARRTLLASSLPAAALGLAACGSTGSDDSSDGGSDAAKDQVVRINGTEPTTSLIPQDVNEVGAGRVIGGLFSMLIFHDPQGRRVLECAESVESDDNRLWTITVRDGLKFSDGTPVTAASFVDAWNFGAAAKNKQRNQAFFGPIEGFADVAADGATATEMSGLKATVERTFTVRLSSPQSDFPDLLGCVPYMPLPKKAFEDIEAFKTAPIGNGPYTLESWKHDQMIELGVSPHYTGVRKARNGGIRMPLYTDPRTAYNDLLSGDLDILDGIPATELPTFGKELGRRAINQPGALIMSLGIPMDAKDYAGEAGRLRRAALSRAIDRAAICSEIFAGTRKPATDFVCPVVNGGGATDLTGGDVLVHDPDAAKDLWAKAEALQKHSGQPLTIDYSSELPDKEWVEALANQVGQTLGITVTPKPKPSMTELRSALADHKVSGAFRASWQADYPSMYNFLGPIYSSPARAAGGTNFTGYANEEFDGLLAKGLEAPDLGAAIQQWRMAEELLLRDLPGIPLWYQNTLGGFGEHAKDVTFGWNSFPFYFDAARK